MLAEIRANSQILLNMVGNTLDASRLEAGRFALSCRQLDVIDVLQSVIATIDPVAKKRGIVLRRQFDMDALLVVSDELALQKIVMNLVSNAVKFSPRWGDGAGNRRVKRGGRRDYLGGRQGARCSRGRSPAHFRAVLPSCGREANSIGWQRLGVVRCQEPFRGAGHYAEGGGSRGRRKRFQRQCPLRGSRGRR